MLKINGLGATMVIMHHSQIIFSTDVQDLYVKCVNSNTTKTQTAVLAKPPFRYENTPSCVFEHFDQLDLKSQAPRLPPSTQTYTHTPDSTPPYHAVLVLPMSGESICNGNLRVASSSICFPLAVNLSLLLPIEPHTTTACLQFVGCDTIVNTHRGAREHKHIFFHV